MGVGGDAVPLAVPGDDDGPGGSLADELDSLQTDLPSTAEPDLKAAAEAGKAERFRVLGAHFQSVRSVASQSPELTAYVKNELERISLAMTRTINSSSLSRGVAIVPLPGGGAFVEHAFIPPRGPPTSAPMRGVIPQSRPRSGDNSAMRGG